MVIIKSIIKYCNRNTVVTSEILHTYVIIISSNFQF